MKQHLLVPFLFLCLSTFARKQDKSSWIISTNSKENYNGVTMANGRIGLVTDEKIFHTKEIVLNGVFDKEHEGGVSQTVRGILPSNLQIAIDGNIINDSNINNWQQELNMKEAIFTTSFTYDNKVKISYQTLALRQLPYATMLSVQVTPLSNCQITVKNQMKTPKEINNVRSSFRILRDAEVYMPIFQTIAKSRLGIHDLAASSTFLFDEKFTEFEHNQKEKDNRTVGFQRQLEKKQSFQFAVVDAQCTSMNFHDPKNESERIVIYAMRQSIDQLINDHKTRWSKLWENDIIIEGDLQSQHDVRLALYNLFSFSREGTRQSIAPMGLSTHKGYNGHIFWDAEIWMYPALLPFESGLAKSMLDYRFDRLDQARQRALNYGYKGAMFPWESDESGEEATPTWVLTGTFEQHVTADVAIAFWNYYQVTHNQTWLKEIGYPVLKEVAAFWTSRASLNNDGSYSIRNVIGANEFAPNVDDNAFTNGSVQVALQNATKAAEILDVPGDQKWSDIAEGLKFHYFENGIMKEHANYKGEEIKQTDVNLLAYPLGITTNKQRMQKELEYYEGKIIENCPAMAHSILSIISAKLGDREEAYRLFKHAYIPNRRAPFGVLSESAHSNNPYFATGAGGMLQAVLYGFGGLEITEEGIKQTGGILPKQWKSLTIKGVGPNNKTYRVE